MKERVSRLLRRRYRHLRENPGLSEREVADRLKPYEQVARRTLVFAGVLQKRADTARAVRPRPKEG